jgi:hypothetical protein
VTTKRRSPQPAAATFAESIADTMAKAADGDGPLPGPFSGSAVSATLTKIHLPWPTAEQILFAKVKRKLGGRKPHDRWARYKAMDAEIQKCWAELREPLPRQLPKGWAEAAQTNARRELLKSGFKGATSLDRIRHDYEDVGRIVEQLRRHPK